MKRFKVTWGDATALVPAETEGDAWAKFAEGNPQAMSTPKLHKRTIEDVTGAKEDTKPKGSK